MRKIIHGLEKMFTVCDCCQGSGQAGKVNGHIVVHGPDRLGLHSKLGGGSQVGKYAVGGEFADVRLGLK